MIQFFKTWSSTRFQPKQLPVFGGITVDGSPGIVADTGDVFRSQGFPLGLESIKGYASTCTFPRSAANVLPLKKIDIAERPFRVSDWGQTEGQTARSDISRECRSSSSVRS